MHQPSLNGELVEVEVLIAYLWIWAQHGRRGHVLGSGYKIRIDAHRGVMPDVQFFRPKNPAAIGQNLGLENGFPDLAVEIISPSSRRYDRVKKLAWYARIGVPEYWIIGACARPRSAHGRPTT